MRVCIILSSDFHVAVGSSSGMLHLSRTRLWIALKWIFDVHGGNVWIKFNWLRTGPNDEIL
jgi:hypothetical protein